MDFINAERLKKLNSHIIGKSFNGCIIEELILGPTDPMLKEKFNEIYYETLDCEKSIIPFIKCDIDIFIICKKDLIRQGIILSTSIFNLPEEFDIVKVSI